MPTLAEIPDRPLAIDLRIALAEAAAWYALRRGGGYTLWPQQPFGASADHNVWPSVFVGPGHSAPDRITLAPGEAPFWDAFNMWDDVRDMVRHMRPLPIPTTVIAVATDAPVPAPKADETALTSLIETDMTAETLQMEAALLGYDIVNGYFDSALFMSHLGGFDAGNVPRTRHGLIEHKADAAELRDRLQTAAADGTALHPVSVWSLGDRPATPPA